jgi:transcriptional regulator with XRE-family HTH domain
MSVNMHTDTTAAAHGQHDTFGARVKRAREQLGLTKSRLAERAGCTEAEVRQIESGRTARPNVHTVLRLAEALNEDPFRLVFGTDSPIIPW